MRHWKKVLLAVFVLSAVLLLRHAWKEGAPRSEVVPPLEAPRADALTWVTPQGWKELPASGMRKGSFSVGTDGDASIIVLKGVSGSLAANVNRWRGQIGLSPLSAADIEKEAKSERGKSGDFQWFHLTGEKSILAAILQKQGETLFVKLTGPFPLVAENVEAFLSLCRSVEW